MLVHYSQHSSVIEAPTWLTLLLYMFAQYNNDCVTSWCILSVNWRHTHWPSFRKWENKGSVLLWYSCFDRSILMFLMREGLQCRISIPKRCFMRLWNDINQLTFVFRFVETRPHLSGRDVSWLRECGGMNDLRNLFVRNVVHCTAAQLGRRRAFCTRRRGTCCTLRRHSSMCLIIMQTTCSGAQQTLAGSQDTLTSATDH